MNQFLCQKNNFLSIEKQKDKGMPSRLIYLITCYRGIKDTITSFFSFIDAFDVIWMPKDNDFVWVSFSVGGKIYSDIAGEIKIELSFVYPDSTTVSSPIIVVGNVQKGDVHFVGTFPITKFTQLGKYKLKAKLNGEELNNNNDFYFSVIKTQI